VLGGGLLIAAAQPASAQSRYRSRYSYRQDYDRDGIPNWRDRHPRRFDRVRVRGYRSSYRDYGYIGDTGYIRDYGLLGPGYRGYDGYNYRDYGTRGYRYRNYGNGGYTRGRDEDRDGIPNRVDRDRDGDGIRNRRDRHPDNWRRR
jgi:hypothetical protein